MSTNSECLFVQVKTNEWFYILEHYNAPKNAWDWRENATAYGPFQSEEAALKHLDRNHANPGGSCTEYLPDGVTELELSGIMKDLVDNARKESAKRNPPLMPGNSILMTSGFRGGYGYRRY